MKRKHQPAFRAAIELVESRLLMSASGQTPIEPPPVGTPIIATRAVVTTQPLSITAGQTDSLVVKLEDANGNIDTSLNAQVTLAIATGPASAALGGTTTVFAVNGIANFNAFTATAAGTYTITANSNSLASDTTSTFTVHFAAASALKFANPPTSAIAGEFIASTLVEITDIYGNVVTTSSAPVTLTGTPDAQFSGLQTVDADHGIATFADLVVTTAGDYQVTASSPTLTDQTIPFTVTPAAPAKIVVAYADSSNIAGTPTSVIAEVQDFYGNRITTDSSTVSLILMSAPNNVDTSNVFTAAAVSGDANFTLPLYTTGNYSVAVWEGTLAGETSQPITITPAAASKLAFKTAPANTVIGKTLGNVTIELRDSFGNLVPDNNTFISLYSSATLAGTTTAATVDGVATFSDLSIATAGSFTVSASSPGFDGVTANVHISATVVAGNKLAPIVAGSPSSTKKTETFRVSIDNGPAKAKLAGATIKRTRTGMVTFSNLKLTVAGVYDLSLASPDGSITVWPLVVLPAAPAKLAFVNKPVTVGNQISATLRVADRFGNCIADPTAVTLTGSITGTLETDTINGLATFSDLLATKTGAINLLATAAAKKARSTAFVSPASVAHLR